MRTLKVLLILVLCLCTPALASHRPPTDDEVRQRMIEESIAAYPGTCACPYSLMKNGRRCGKRSAWHSRGGYAPLCYTTDITDEMVKEWRERMGE